MGARVAYLMAGDDVIGSVEDIEPDMPWFEGRFSPGARFSEFEPLFARELHLLESEPFEAAEWEQGWEEIWSRGAALVLPSGQRVERDFVLHVYADGTARFRH